MDHWWLSEKVVLITGGASGDWSGHGARPGAKGRTSGVSRARGLVRRGARPVLADLTARRWPEPRRRSRRRRSRSSSMSPTPPRVRRRSSASSLSTDGSM